MPPGPALASPGRDEDPALEPVPTPDPMTQEDWLAWCEATAGQGEPTDPDEEEPDPDGLPGPWEYDLTFRWTTPSGRQYTTEPTRYPI